MAMTKKERAAFDALEKQLRTVAALRWTSAIAPDVDPPTASGDETCGWITNAYTATVSPAWSGVVCHGIGVFSRKEARSSGSQRSVCLHSTKLRALQALRHEMECKFAAALAAVDKQIEDAATTGATP
jgi:hypothetical protein